MKRVNERHGLTAGRKRPPEYNSWWQMRYRCQKSSNKGFPSYGGRGIRVCERWNSFTAFLADMGPRPSPQHSIERIDNDGHYEPGNCVWATKAEQARNTRRTKLSPTKVEQIRVAHECGAGVMAIARRFGVDHSLISHIIAGRCWQSVEREAA